MGLWEGRGGQRRPRVKRPRASPAGCFGRMARRGDGRRGLLLLLLLAALVANGMFLPLDPDMGKTVPELVAGYGYPIESHYVTTADGYILNIFRIPRGASCAGGESRRRPVVLLQHALLDSSFAYVSGTPQQSLAYLLADAGYDVWLGNNRGNAYSTNHTFLPTSGEAFWDFTWDEMARYDLPAEIDYILSSTGAAQLSYVGHSQGTIQAFAGFSHSDELEAKVNVFVAMAPVAYNSHAGGLWGGVLRPLGLIKLLRRLGARRSFMQTGGFFSRFGPSIVRAAPWFTSAVINWVCGDSRHLNITRSPVIIGHTPAGASIKTMEHWEQAAESGFRMFDYGSEAENIARYNATRPPDYHLGDLNVPTALFLGGQDPLSRPADVDRLLREIRPGVVFRVETLPTYGHVDFTWAADAHRLLYPGIMEVLGSRSAW